MGKWVDRCRSCGEEFINHKGVEGTCRDLQSCMGALKVIYTWADYDRVHGYKALVPDHVVSLIDKKFKEIGVEYGERDN